MARRKKSAHLDRLSRQQLTRYALLLERTLENPQPVRGGK